MGLTSWHRQARLLDSLAGCLDAGLPPDRSLALAADAAGGAVGRRGRAAAAQVAAGRPLSAALAAAGEDARIAAVAAAGEAAGCLPPLLRQLAAAYVLRARLRDEAVSRAAYPVLLLHAALVVPALPGVVAGALPAAALVAGPAALWLLAACLLVGAWQTRRSGLAARLALLPPLAAVCRPAIDADLCAVARAALGAGMLPPAALELTADAVPNRVVAARLRAAARLVGGERLPDVAAALAEAGVGGDLLGVIATGETSGRLDQALGQAATIAAERFALRVQWAARLANGAVYAVAVIVAVVVILGMYQRVYGGLAAGLEGP